MLEIYNEQVRDLLTKDNPKGGLQVSFCKLREVYLDEFFVRNYYYFTVDLRRLNPI